MTSTGSTIWLGGRRVVCPRSVASTTFVPSNAPPVPVSAASTAPSSLIVHTQRKRIYLGCLGNPAAERWPLQTVTSARTEEGVLDALRTGPYGRCVYRCDNDVVDHQVVNLEYEGGTTASFTMTAFTDFAFRQTKIFGTHGCLEGNGREVEVLNFRTGKRERHLIEGSSEHDPHAGGDIGLVRAFIEALISGRPEDHLTTPEESLASHLVTWAAEEARLTSTVVHLS